MENIALAAKSKDEVESVYLEVREMTVAVEEVNDALDSLEPLVDRLNHQLEVSRIKSKRLKSKMSEAMAKM